MLIKIKQGWEVPEASVTPERLVFNRRGMLKGLGLTALTGALASCDNSSSVAQSAPPGGSGAAPQAVQAAQAASSADPTAKLYPVKRNPAYVLDRPLTNESIIASYNNYYEFNSSKDVVAEAQALPIRPWEISIEGMVDKPFKTDFDSLIKLMPLEERLYRHRCVETWSFTAAWSGFPMKALVDYAKPSSGAKYVVMKSFMNPNFAPGEKQPWYPWPYTEGLTIAEATHDMAFMVTGAYGKPLLKQNGAPLRLATPWKYGFKSAKGIQRFIFTDKRPVTYWQQLAQEEYGFWANVNPKVPHPRWSQDSETSLTTGARVPTLLFNGYAAQVAGLYANLQAEPLYM